MPVSTGETTSVAVNGITIEMVDRGRGRPILLLHPDIGIEAAAPVLNEFARGGRVIAPSHPGFGASQLPSGMSTVDDLSYFYLDLLEQLDLTDVLVVGIGLGGWIAAEIAIKNSARLSRLVMANAVGVKIGDRETRDIVDIWSITPSELNALAYFDPKIAERDYKTLPPETSLAAARNREATARFCWSPYMHDPKLKSRLHRIKLPTLFLWGTADRILSEAYGRAYCALIPGAAFETIERAGHYPHVEQPEAFARRALAFAGDALQTAARARRA
ncbi:alpha/beta hydrolase [Pseudorhodoplanes sp.]|uniref:alpha/beta fold hydrolase n=1 Tax=Pseudorhodoplanes sp. TaxID=1934341 RepID=UPI002CFD7C21|nr:alpha/beta hydrolase [Pseudorhodoplanes sp.]HWL31360.1 alpha/beta hydrolase [Xanthobacteraceae bacterium]HWV42465.1 alpha/beta hydrolase [Pseudorhodoplanes sp.]